MKIAIVGAMEEEIAPFVEKFECDVINIANNKFYTFKYKNHDIILAYSKIGKINAAITATLMISKFQAEILIFTGVAGALNDELKIADLLYATSLVQHDLDISAFGHPFGYVPGVEIFIKTDEKLNKIALQTAKDLGISLHGGIIASGDQFVCDAERKKWIRKTFSADAVEMEGSSIAVVCSSLNVPFFVLRAISDGAGGGAEFDFDKFLLQAAKVSADFTLKMIDKL